MRVENEVGASQKIFDQSLRLRRRQTLQVERPSSANVASPVSLTRSSCASSGTSKTDDVEQITRADADVRSLNRLRTRIGELLVIGMVCCAAEEQASAKYEDQRPA